MRPTFLSCASEINLSRRSNWFGLLLIDAFGHCFAFIGAFPENEFTGSTASTQQATVSNEEEGKRRIDAKYLTIASWRSVGWEGTMTTEELIRALVADIRGRATTRPLLLRRELAPSRRVHGSQNPGYFDFANRSELPIEVSFRRAAK